MLTFPIGFFQAIQTGGIFATNTAALNGSSQYFNAGNPSALQLTGDFTIATRFKLVTPSDTQYLFGKWTSATDRSFYLNTFASKLNFQISVDGTALTVVGSSTTLIANTWYTVTVGLRSGTAFINLDGATNASAAHAGAVFNSTGSFLVGRLSTDPAHAPFSIGGELGMFRAWNRGLSDIEITEEYNLGTPQCVDAMSAGLNTNLVYAPRLANWGTNAGEELDDQSTNSTVTTNVGSTPFTGTGLNVDCTPVGEGRLYHCDSDSEKLYEIDPDTLLDISSGGVTSPSTRPRGIGGTSTRLYNCDSISDKLYEIDIDALLDISSGGVTSPSSAPQGLGGTSTRLYHCDSVSAKIYEIDPDTLLDISSGGVTSPSTNPRGMGGTSTRLYHCDINTGKLYEIDPDTLLDISSGGVTSPSSTPLGVGGTSTRLYHCDTNTDKLYEIDPDTLLDISSGGVTSPSSAPQGLGGIKTS